MWSRPIRCGISTVDGGSRRTRGPMSRESPESLAWVTPMAPNPGPTLRGRRRECDMLDHVVDEARLPGAARCWSCGAKRASANPHFSITSSPAPSGAGSCGHSASNPRSSSPSPVSTSSAPLLDHVERIPTPQRDALAVALGSQSGDAPDRFLVGLAVLSLLAEVAEDEPLVCVIDDAEWLDQASAQVLAFVARRLLAEPVAMVIAIRSSDDEGDDWCRASGAHGSRAHRGRCSNPAGGSHPRTGRCPSPRSDRVGDACGNPLASLELPRGMSPAELAFGFAGSDSMPLATRIESGFVRRLHPLSVETRRGPAGRGARPWSATSRCFGGSSTGWRSLNTR